jgi:hypothetical protein
VAAAIAFVLPQHPDEHRPKRPILLAVDQELGEGATARVRPELADPRRHKLSNSSLASLRADRWEGGSQCSLHSGIRHSSGSCQVWYSSSLSSASLRLCTSPDAGSADAVAAVCSP